MKILLSLVTLSTLAFLLLLSHPQFEPSTKKTNASQPDSFIKMAFIKHFDKQGKLHAQMSSPKMTHITSNNTTLFDQPNILLYTAHQTPWHVKARHGKSTRGKETIYLWGDVVLHQPKSAQEPETTITTTALTIHPTPQTANTNQPVTIKRPGAITNAIGLTANFKTGIIKLLSHAKGHYDPEKTH